MPVALLPPLTISGHIWDGQTVPLYEAPRYVRGRNMQRWHRPRSGQQRSQERATLHFWCGAGYVVIGECLTADRIPEPDPVCGTCEGRALGAGQDDVPDVLPRLAFEPRWLVPPKLCPASGATGGAFGLVELAHPGSRAGVCRACGELVPVRGCGSRWSGDWGPVRHEPGPGLFAPCPWHAWNFPRCRPDGTVGCRCGWRDA